LEATELSRRTPTGPSPRARSASGPSNGPRGDTKPAANGPSSSGPSGAQSPCRRKPLTGPRGPSGQQPAHGPEAPAAHPMAPEGTQNQQPAAPAPADAAEPRGRAARSFLRGPGGPAASRQRGPVSLSGESGSPGRPNKARTQRGGVQRRGEPGGGTAAAEPSGRHHLTRRCLGELTWD
jgi:hypothetical protein